MRIVLASASPRRRELLEQIGLHFEVMTSYVEEHVSSDRPDEVVEELSRQKAEAVAAELSRQDAMAASKETPRQKAETASKETPPQKAMAAEGELSSGKPEALLVIGADTVVALDGAILGKPDGKPEAFSMLKRLQGRGHEVYTGVTLLYRASGAAGWTQMCFHERTKVNFFPMGEAEISEYVNTGDPLDKAGAYGIQGVCARYISGIEGDYNNVVGLPVGTLYQKIKELAQHEKSSHF